MFAHDQPNVVVLGDSNTWAFGPAFVDTLEQRGWPRAQLVLSYRSGSKSRHWLPRSHRDYHDGHGALLDRKANQGKVSVHDALSPLTKLVIVGLGGNNIPGTRDDHASSTLVGLIERLAPFARIVWRGPPPSTATRKGKVATSRTRASRYRKNAIIKRDLQPLGFVSLTDKVVLADTRIYLDVLALHACGPAPRVRPLACGRDVDLKAEQVLVTSLMLDKHAKGEVAARGPWHSFSRARDGLPSHVPRGRVSADFVDIVAKRRVLDTTKVDPKLPLEMVVVDPKALVRRGAPRFKPINDRVIEQGAIVCLDHWQGRYGHVSDPATGEAIGWTMRLNLALS